MKVMIGLPSAAGRKQESIVQILEIFLTRIREWMKQLWKSDDHDFDYDNHDYDYDHKPIRVNSLRYLIGPEVEIR